MWYRYRYRYVKRRQVYQFFFFCWGKKRRNNLALPSDLRSVALSGSALSWSMSALTTAVVLYRELDHSRTNRRNPLHRRELYCVQKWYFPILITNTCHFKTDKRKRKQPRYTVPIVENYRRYLKKVHPGSRIRKKFIPDPDIGGKKAPDTRSGFATLLKKLFLYFSHFFTYRYFDF
jgi:hypothetical protein